VGKGTLLAIVVPDDFPILKTIAAPERLQQRSKGWEPVPPANYMMNFVEQVSLAIAGARSVGKGETLDDWGFAQLDYQIILPRR